MATTSPTQRALKEMRSLGFLPAVVEKWNPHARIRQDLYGCIDLLGILPGVGILGVQATSRPNHAARRAKSLAEPRLRTWLASGGRFEIWSFAKMGARGKVKRWEVWREEITLDQLVSDPNDREEAPPENPISLPKSLAIRRMTA